MKLNSKQRKMLRARAHQLKPSVIIGKTGLSDSVFRSIQDHLEAHELMKIKFNEHKGLKGEMLSDINGAINSQTVGVIGNIGIIYKQNPDIEKQIYKLD